LVKNRDFFHTRRNSTPQLEWSITFGIQKQEWCGYTIV